MGLNKKRNDASLCMCFICFVAEANKFFPNFSKVSGFGLGAGPRLQFGVLERKSNSTRVLVGCNFVKKLYLIFNHTLNKKQRR